MFTNNALKYLPAKALGFTFMALYTVLVVAPIIWVLGMSFRTTSAIRSNPYALPESIDFSKYINIIGEDYLKYYTNSIMVVAVAIIGIIIISSSAAYCFAKLPFKGSNAIFTIVFSAIMLPAQVLIIPLFQILVKVNLYDNLFGLALVYIAVQSPMAVYILRGFFAQTDNAIIESARIDGCSEYMIFWRIMFPIARPGISSILVLNLVQLWNEYLYAVIFLQSNTNRTLPLGIMKFVGETSMDIASVAASVMLSIIPILLIYCVFSQSFIKSMSMGAVKG